MAVAATSSESVEADASLLADALIDPRTAGVRAALTARWNEVRHLFSSWGEGGVTMMAFKAGLEQGLGLRVSATQLGILFAQCSARGSGGRVDLRLLDMLLRPGELSDRRLADTAPVPSVPTPRQGFPSKPPSPAWNAAPPPLPLPYRALHEQADYAVYYAIAAAKAREGEAARERERDVKLQACATVGDAVAGAISAVAAQQGPASNLTAAQLANQQRRERKREFEQRLKKAFDAVDVDLSGTLTKRELYKALNLAGVHGTARQLLEWNAAGDLDGDGLVDWEEFKDLARHLIRTTGLGFGKANNAKQKPLQQLDAAEKASAFGLRRPKLTLAGRADPGSTFGMRRPCSAASLPTLSSGGGSRAGRPASASAASLQRQGALTPLLRAESQQLVFTSREKSATQLSRSRAMLARDYPELLPGELA